MKVRGNEMRRSLMCVFVCACEDQAEFHAMLIKRDYGYLYVTNPVRHLQYSTVQYSTCLTIQGDCYLPDLEVLIVHLPFSTLFFSSSSLLLGSFW
jgi:hypothetical protein